MNRTNELRDRVEAKRKEIEAQLHEARADARGSASENVEKLQKKLDELGETIKDGWDSVTDAVAGKLNDWLK